MEEEFLMGLSEAADKLVATRGTIRILSHADCDGITAASILIKALKKLNRNFVVSFVRSLTSEVLKEISLEDYKIVIFTDLGSGNLENISKILNERDIFIFDHHQINDFPFDGIHINPLNYGVNAENGISAAGVVYLLTKIIDSRNKENAYLAIIGAIGDMQEYKGFTGLNKMILEDAKDLVELKLGLRVFGSQTRSLHKALEYSTEMFIPGVTGNERGAINFLQRLDIDIQEKNGKYRKLVNLSIDEMKRLVSAIILKRFETEKNAEDVLGNVYLLKGENDEDITKDLKEFSTLLNATARLNKAGIGLGVCLNDKEMKEKASELLSNYKIEIINSLNWFYKNRNSKNVIEKDKYVIINAEEYVKDTLIGTIASIISKSGIYKEGIIIIAMAHTIDGFTKISTRVVGNTTINLRNILVNIINKIGGESGGHDMAAGALILQEKDEEFIGEVKNYLGRLEQIV